MIGRYRAAVVLHLIKQLHDVLALDFSEWSCAEDRNRMFTQRSFDFAAIAEFLHLNVSLEKDFHDLPESIRGIRSHRVLTIFAGGQFRLLDGQIWKCAELVSERFAPNVGDHLERFRTARTEHELQGDPRSIESK